jgi:hypothetical protein
METIEVELWSVQYLNQTTTARKPMMAPRIAPTPPARKRVVRSFSGHGMVAA